jgi:group I intron endonuclease
MIVQLYKITRRETGQSYIGISTNARKRKNTHWWIANKKPPRFFQLVHKVVAKYGRAAFDFEIIACSRDYTAALCAERALIRQWRSHVSDGGYNLTLGGEGLLGRKMSDETKAKISATKSGRKGRPITEAEKTASRARLLSLTLDQRIERAQHAAASRIRNGTDRGRKNPPETIAKMRASALARWARSRDSQHTAILSRQP